ncbi:unnamed protein product [Phytophthora fragariaefolia]|uniref:Unnamed protein product n=1 Tax=Phytophthora fragariaefolia TaxID=1490495 RepID=A0A9W6XYD4_9STRA|nr:unnamed protein product [Phytophthora fragariaefolia]
MALGLGDSAGHGEGSLAQPLELSDDSSEGEPGGTVVSSSEPTSGREQRGHRDGSTVSGPKTHASAPAAPASDGDDSSEDSDDIPIRDIVTRMQTGQSGTRGKTEAVQRPRSPLLGKKKRQAERPTPERDTKRKRKPKHRESARAGQASWADDRGSSKKAKPSAPPDSADGSRPPNKSRRTRSSLSSASSGSLPPTGVPSATVCPADSTGSSVAVATRTSDPHPGAHSVPALPAALRVPFSTLQPRAAQAASRDSRITPQNARLHELRFLHFGSFRCWKAILESQTGQIAQVGEGRPRIPPTPCSLAGLRAFADVYNPRHPAQWLRKLLPADSVFCSPLAFSHARTRLANSARSSTLMEKLAEVWIKLRGEIPNSADSGNSASLAWDDHPTRYFVALWERTHWIVESSVMMRLHPSQQTSSSNEEIAEVYAEWFKYKLNRKRRSDALRGLMTSISDGLFSAVMKVVDGVPAPDVDAEVYFEPSVPVYPLVTLS